tara:strand:- start:1036 stop:1260 length:225 start_codon:yes stop_codon:yes gene_type:complete
MTGKGSKRRKENKKKIDKNWDKIFKDANKTKAKRKALRQKDRQIQNRTLLYKELILSRVRGDNTQRKGKSKIKN